MVCLWKKSIMHRVLSICLTSAVAVLGTTHAADAREFTFEIEPQSTDGALFQLAEVAEVQILFSPQATGDTRSSGLQGTHSVREALDATLAGTGLAYEFKSDDFVVVTAGNSGTSGSGGKASGRAMEGERGSRVKLASLQQRTESKQEDKDNADKKAKQEKEEPLELTDQRVTGTRLLSGDPTARVVSITAEEIAVRGVSDLEELFRTLPWAFPSITTQTNTTPGINAPDTDKDLGTYGLGISTVNLRAMGSAYTLVLVNGRRVAGAAGHEENFANLLNVPISAIERVDVQLGGGSAVYGSDAVGGIVNFILKQGYRGVSATVRREYSSSGADRDRLSLQSGYAWDSGNLSFNLSRNKTVAIVNAKTGWTSNDYREQFGPEFDMRNRILGQPSVVCEFRNFPIAYLDYRLPSCDDFRRPTRYQLPADHSGVGATVDDFSTDIRPFDYVFPRNGSDSTNTSFTVNVEQYITDNLRVYADVLYSKLDSYLERQTTITAVVPGSNAYNPFGRTMIVTYWPGAEIEAGLIPPAFLDGEAKQQNYNLGVVWSFRGHELELGLTRSEARQHAFRTFAAGVRAQGDPSADKYYAALESSDPAQALNLFGNGSAQPSLFGELFSRFRGRRGTTESTGVESLLRGQLFQVWGGAVNYALGAEFRKDVIFRHTYDYDEDGLTAKFGPEEFYGVARPTLEFTAYFAELAIPLVGEDNARPGLQSLVLNLQARNDSYESAGSSGRDFTRQSITKRVYVPNRGWSDYSTRVPVYFGDLNLTKNKKSATSPRIGLLYKPVESLIARASWSRSFRPPGFGDLYTVFPGETYTRDVTDLAHPSGMPVEVPSVVHYNINANPDLKPESSDNYTLGLDWSPQSLPGFRWTVDWSRIDFTNRIERGYNILYGEPIGAYAHPQIVRRDADGYITSIFWGEVNIAAKISETVETELQYAFETRLGDFSSRLSYSRVLEEMYQVTANSPRIERKGTASGSSEYRLTGSVSWTKGNFAVDAFAYYTPGYRNDLVGVGCQLAVGRCESRGDPLPTLMVDSLTTVDLAVTYRFDNGLRLRGGGRNVFKATAPTIWHLRPYDPTRWDARGQVLYLELNWEM